MVRKIFKTGNSLVVSLPKESVKLLGWQEGSEVSIAVDQEHGRLIIEPAVSSSDELDATFARQLAEFIETYRPALEALAK